MSDSYGSPPDSVYAVWAVNLAAYVVLIIFSVTGDDPWPAFGVALLAFVIAGVNWFRLRANGTFHPLATSCWAGGLAAVAWSIGLLAAYL